MSAGAASKRRSPKRYTRVDGWTEVRRTRVVQALREGASITDACRSVDISTTSFRRLRDRDAAFREACDAAQMRCWIDLETVAYERAVNGYDEPVFWQGQQVGVRRVYPEELLIVLLAMRIPHKYRDLFPAYRPSGSIRHPDRDLTKAQVRASMLARFRKMGVNVPRE